MAIASFEALCAGFFSVAGLAPQVLQANANGRSAFTVRLRGVLVTVMHSCATPDAAFVLVEYGAVPPDKRQAAWEELLDANLKMLGKHTPVFGRNPANGEVVLRLCYPLDSATPVDLYQRVVSMVSAAQTWREHCALNDANASALDANPAFSLEMLA